MSKEIKRVVVTGLGMITALGNDVTSNWRSACQGDSGCAPITLFDASPLKTTFACEVKNLDTSSLLDAREVQKLDRYVLFALACADEALRDSKIDLSQTDCERIGVVWATGIGGISSLQEGIVPFGATGVPRFSPFFIPKTIPNMGAAQVSIRWGLKGPCYAISSACASSATAIANASMLIQAGKATMMVVGGSEAPITACSIGAFNALRALSTRNDECTTASRPFSLSRDGFVMGEGGGCLVLEEYEHAIARGATIYAEIAGIGMNADAYHITAPEPTGSSAAKVMQLALEDANIQPSDVQYINAHGTSTSLGDVAEVKAIQMVFGEHSHSVNISSTKSMIGHLLGGAGAVEAIFSILAIKHGVIPPTINHLAGDEDPNIDQKINFTFNQAQKQDVRYAISNNFGFGGHNACLVFRRVE